MTSFEPMSDEEWAELRDFDANYEQVADTRTMPAGLVAGSREHRAMSAQVKF